MNDSPLLAQLLKSTVTISLEEERGKTFARLQEPNEKDCEVTLRDLPDDAIVLKADSFPAPTSVFQGTKGECKRADYIIISEKKKCVLHIELKKTKDIWADIVNQLKGAHCVFVYLKEIGKEFGREKTFLEKYKHCFVSIGHIGIAKGPVRFNKKHPRNDTPERALQIASPHHLSFNQLICI